jgi:hypothetical protein
MGTGNYEKLEIQLESGSPRIQSQVGSRVST